ncbi:hypothetical protein PG988_001884 [Apiospora saccharicola]
MSHRVLVRRPNSPLSHASATSVGHVSLWGPTESGDSTVAQHISSDDEDLADGNYTLIAASPSVDAIAPITPAVIARWRGEIESLSSEQRQVFLRGLPEAGLQQYADAVSDLINDKVQKSQSVRLGKWVAPLVQFVEMSRPFTEALNSIYPPAGMILGGVSYVLSMSKRHVDYQEAVVSFLVKICKNLSILDRYKKKFPETEEMQLALIDVYGDILQFCVRASKPFLDGNGNSRATAVTFFRSQIKPFAAEFGDLENSLATHLEVFDRTAVLVLGQMSAHSQETQLLSLKMHARALDAEKRRRAEEENRRRMEEEKAQIYENAENYQGTDPIEDEFRQGMLNWISLTDLRKVQDEKLESTLEGTAQWLLDHDNFLAWKFKSRPRLLYLHGKAGSGKSHLAAKVIRDLELWCRQRNAEVANVEKQRRFALAYIYCSATLAEPSNQKYSDGPSETRAGVGALLASILRQLYSCLPKDQDVDFLANIHRESQSSIPATEDIREGIRLIVSKFDKAFIVIDGLDECNALKDIEFEHLCNFIYSLASSSEPSNPTSIIVFSRPGYSTVEEAFHGATRIPVDAGANKADIDMFISERARNITASSSTLQEIKDTLSADADGMFLWVSLIVDSVKKERSDNRRKKAAKNMPRGLAGAYSVALDRVMAQEESVKDVALRALLWIANSERPLSKPELLEALSIEPGMVDMEAGDRFDDLSLARDCADLVVFKNGQYSLLHISLKEYLTHQPIGPSEPSMMEYWTLQHDAHAVLANLCLTYLTFGALQHRTVETREGLNLLLEEYPLLEYSAIFWGYHVKKAAMTINHALLLQATDFLKDDHLLQLSGQASWNEKESFRRRNLRPLHMICAFGLDEILPFFERAELEIESRDIDGDLPIDYAMKFKQKKMTEWIICQYEGMVDRTRDGILSSKNPLVCLAARNDWADIITRLLNMGFDKDQWGSLNPDVVPATALQYAVRHGSEEAALLLIETGASLDLQDSFGDTALTLATAMQRSRTIDALLRHGANVKLRGKLGNTALHNAIYNNLLDPARNILARGADVGAICLTGSCLHVAAVSGAHDMIDLLLTHGANIESRNARGDTPLLSAIWKDTAFARRPDSGQK